jgi:hypothetical protein
VCTYYFYTWIDCSWCPWGKLMRYFRVRRNVVDHDVKIFSYVWKVL